MLCNITLLRLKAPTPGPQPPTNDYASLDDKVTGRSTDVDASNSPANSESNSIDDVVANPYEYESNAS